MESSSPEKSPQLTPSQFSDGTGPVLSWPHKKYFHQNFMSSGSPKGLLGVDGHQDVGSLLVHGGRKSPEYPSSSAISLARSARRKRKSSRGIPRLFPRSQGPSPHPCEWVPGTLSRSPGGLRARRIILSISTPWGQAYSHRPQRVQIQGKRESISSWSMPQGRHPHRLPGVHTVYSCATGQPACAGCRR